VELDVTMTVKMRDVAPAPWRARIFSILVGRTGESGRGLPPLHFASHVERLRSMALLSATVKELYSSER
jgi:hypothetical protein